MASGTVGWHFFDAESERLSEEFGPSILPGGGVGRTVIIAASPFAQADGWAAKAVIAIAKGWAEENLRIFLMDLGLVSPSLHKALGLMNQEGVSDAFLYGASVQRIAQPALDDAIFFAPAGTATTDPQQILGHPRWNDLAGGFSEADATLLLYLPTDIAGAEKILAWATDIVFLAGEGESAEDHLGPASVKVVGNFGPEGVAPAGHGPDAGESEAADGGLAGSELGGMEEGGLIPEGGALEEPGGGEVALGGGLSLSASFTEGGDPTEDPGEDELVLEGADTDPVTGLEIPDFGAEFADMPALEHEIEEDEDEEGFESLEGPTEQLLVGGDIVLENEFSSGHLSDADMQTPPPDVEDDPEVSDGAVEKKEKPEFKRDRPRPLSSRRRPRRKLFTPPKVAGGIAALGILVAVVGTALGSFNVPGLTWLQDVFGRVPFPTEGVSGPQPVEPNLRFSLEYEVYDADELGVAIEMRNTLRGRLPDLLFHLTPQERNGAVSYALHMGPAADAVDAENLRGPLGEVFDREDPESWPIRVTPKAFLLGEMDTLAEAQEFMVNAEAQGALGYIVRVSYSDGSGGYRVLSGAYDGAVAARWWQLNLRENGFRNLPFVDRQGIWPE